MIFQTSSRCFGRIHLTTSWLVAEISIYFFCYLLRRNSGEEKNCDLYLCLSLIDFILMHRSQIQENRISFENGNPSRVVRDLSDIMILPRIFFPVFFGLCLCPLNHSLICSCCFQPRQRSPRGTRPSRRTCCGMRNRSG